MNPLELPQRLRVKLAEHRAKALKDAVTREQRSQVLQIIQKTYPRTDDMKHRQAQVDQATDEVMQVFENYHYETAQKLDT